MTKNKSLLYLSRSDVEQVALDMGAIIGLLEKAFRERVRVGLKCRLNPAFIPEKTPSFMPCLLIFLP